LPNRFLLHLRTCLTFFEGLHGRTGPWPGKVKRRGEGPWQRWAAAAMSGMFGGLGLGESVGTFGECPRGVRVRRMLVRQRAAVREYRGRSEGCGQGRGCPCCVCGAVVFSVLKRSARRRRSVLCPAFWSRVRAQGVSEFLEQPPVSMHPGQLYRSVRAEPWGLNDWQARKRASSTVSCSQRHRRPTAGRRLKANSCALSGARSLAISPRPPFPSRLLGSLCTCAQPRDEASVLCR